MPHKHTRRGEVDKSTVDLPPNVIANPLPVSKSAGQNGIFTSTNDSNKRANKKRKRNQDTDDDTPKAFLRLMAMVQGKKLPKGLDDGVKPSKKQRKAATAAAGAVGNEDNVVVERSGLELERPTIRPGERMSDFAARVDAALPVSGLINKGIRQGKDPLGLKVGRTKTEKRMHKMYAEWRVEEVKRQDKRQEALELAEEEQMDEDGQVKWKVDIDAASTPTTTATDKKGKKGKGKKKKVLGEVDDGDKDPWAKIRRDRGETRAGLHDVVQAPPTFSKVPREKFKVRGAAVEVGDVPKASGSLRRREELGEVRRSVVEGYRAMMKANKERMREE